MISSAVQTSLVKMKTIGSIVLLHALLGIITTAQRLEKGDAKTIIVIMSGQSIKPPENPTQRETSNLKQREHKKNRWLQHWVKRMLLSKK